jgi:hypothetical protein
MSCERWYITALLAFSELGWNAKLVRLLFSKRDLTPQKSAIGEKIYQSYAYMEYTFILKMDAVCSSEMCNRQFGGTSQAIAPLTASAMRTLNQPCQCPSVVMVALTRDE